MMALQLGNGIYQTRKQSQNKMLLSKLLLDITSTNAASFNLLSLP